MEETWTYLTTGNNSAAWTLIVTLVSAFAGFVWWLVKRRDKSVSADRGGVAIGGDANGARIATRSSGEDANRQ